MDHYSILSRERDLDTEDRDGFRAYKEPAGSDARSDRGTRSSPTAARRIERRDPGRIVHAASVAAGRTQAAFVVRDPAASLGTYLRWGAALALGAALYAAVAAYILAPMQKTLDGAPSDVVSIDLIPDPSTDADKPDDVAGPKVPDVVAPTSDETQAEDPDPPAPDAAPPTEAKREPEKAPDITAPQAHLDAEAVLPPPETQEERPPEPKPPVEKTPEAKEDKIERKTTASQASTGSAALLSGGKRPSAAAQASWKGDVGALLVKHRRYPPAARSKGWQGVARVKVTIDENGHVLASELAKGTGHEPLDSEAVALMHRSDPFPKPPAGLPVPIVMTVPVNFNIH